ncbi:hypothetical protein MYSTI_02754 [Myxococcus stipitatus DSM 14675]|uniref:Lipoprotein n=1 Tax=Myxococcus stipitatus (strain DSM 14675 / JCM 12634 / Mx s8) TaxID=1278073 RepID=L7U8D5_MYXSD|nr:hypothetical protein [Myxococcus stipitatus]AGC44070.1 hypothetical protein MYSTI_02754 [Myxococcus stipitatus DSM 14675]
MKLISKSLFAGVAALVLSPLSASALPPDCDEICWELEACNTTCAVPWTTRIINCGIWEDQYHQPGSCQPSLSEGGEEELMSSGPVEDVNASWEENSEQ